MVTGVVTGDFAQIISDWGRTVSYSIVTKTTDSMSGNETDTYATASNQSVIFFLNETRYVWDKEGLLAVGDAYIIAPITLGIKRYDKFTIDSQEYFIENTIRRNITGIDMADYAICFKTG